MNIDEFKKKWIGADPDKMENDELLAYKNDCFAMYEHHGFIPRFDSPYDDHKEHHNMRFKVIRRANTTECDLETMPIWLVEFENGDNAYCYPEEITVIEHQKKAVSRILS